MASSDKLAAPRGQGLHCDWCGFESAPPPHERCGRCGAEGAKGARHCHACGAPMGAILGEGPKVGGGALLALRIEGLGTVAAHSGDRLGPALRRLDRAIEEVVAAQSGELDGAMGTYHILFEALGDDLPGAGGRALSAALELQHRLDDLLQGLAMEGVVLAPLMALHLGAGVVLREGARVHPLPEAREQLDLLLGLGVHYGIVIGQSLVDVSGVELRTVPLAEGLGRSGSAAFRVEGLDTQGLPAPGWVGEGSSVGRDIEMDFLERRWRAVKNKETSAIVTLIGPSGVGKRRLVEDLLVGLGPRSERSEAIASAQPGGDPQAFGLISQAILRLIGSRPEDRSEEIRRRLHHAARKACQNLDLREDAREARQMTALIAPFLGMAWTSPETARLEATSLKEGAFFALIRLIDGWTRFRPGLLVLEDVHDADALSLEFLQRLGQTPLSRGRIFVLVTAAPSLLSRASEWGVAFWHHDFLRLDPLQVDALMEVGQGVAQRHGPVSDWVLEELAERADGDPYFMEQLSLLAVVKAAQGTIPGESTGFSGDDMAFEEEDDLIFDEGLGDEGAEEVWPVDLAATITRRITRLDPPLQELLGLVALMDQPIPLSSLDAVWLADRREPVALHRGLQILEVQGFLRRRVGTQEWRLRGGLLGELAAARLSEIQRGHWARRLAHHLQEEGCWDRFVASYVQVGRLLEAGGLLDAALRYYALGASRARRLGAPEEADAAFGRALRLATRQDHAPALRESIAISLTRGSLRLSLGQIPEALEDLNHAKEMATALGEDRWRWDVQLVLAEALDAQGLLDRASHTFEAVAEGSTDPRQRIRALRRAGGLRFKSRDPKAAQAFLSEALVIAGESGLDLRQLAQLLDDLSIQRWMNGDGAQAIQGADALLDYLKRTLPSGDSLS